MVFANVSRPCDICGERKDEIELGTLKAHIKSKYIEVHYCRDGCLAEAQQRIRDFLEENRED